MTTESRMREALKKARAAIQYQRLPSIDLLNAYDAISEALSPPARRTSYMWTNGGGMYRVAWVRLKSDRKGVWIIEERVDSEWRRTMGGAYAAAAIATLAGLTPPEEEA